MKPDSSILGVPDNSPRKSFGEWSIFLILLGVTLLGALLRFYRLSYQSFWFDESISYEFAQRRLILPFVETLGNDVHPPLYFLMLKAWVEFFGPSDVAVRALSAIVSVASVPLIYFAALAFTDRRGALYAAVIACASLFQIAYAQEARGYSLLVFLATLSLLFLGRALRSNHPRHLLLFGITGALLVLTHYLALLFVGVEFLILALHWIRTSGLKPSFARFGTAVLPIVVIAGAWCPIFLRQFNGVREGFWLHTPRLSDLALLYGQFIALHTPHFIVRRTLFSYGAVAAALLAGILLSFCERSAPFAAKSARSPAYWPRVHPACRELDLIALDVEHVLSARARGECSPFYILVAILIANIRLRELRSLAFALILFPALRAYHSYYFKLHKEDWRAVNQIIRESARPADSFIFVSPAGELSLRHYLGAVPLKTVQFGSVPESERVWLIHSLSKVPLKVALGKLEEQGFSLERMTKAEQIDVALLRRSTEDASSATAGRRSNPQEPNYMLLRTRAPAPESPLIGAEFFSLELLPQGTQVVPRSALIDGGRSTGVACEGEAPNRQPLLGMKMSWW